MTSEQEHLVNVYGCVTAVIVLLVLLRNVYHALRVSFQACVGSHKRGIDTGVNFSDSNASAYVSQFRSKEFPYTLVICQTENPSDELYDWTDPERSHEHYNVTMDAKEILGEVRQGVFDTIKHWPPAHKQSMEEIKERWKEKGLVKKMGREARKAGSVWHL